MQLSAPIYALKRKAKLLARQTDIALHQALDNVAINEGFQSWSQLISSSVNKYPVKEILTQLQAGDLILIGARPGQGKSLLGLELVSKASQVHRKGYFFTLDFHEREVSDRLSAMGVDPSTTIDSVVIDTSDEVSADYITSCVRTDKVPALIVVDYLQLLDQKRSNPCLEDQMRALQRYVISEGAICAVISQIDRSFDLSSKLVPDISDIRLPNPLDLSVFHKFFFLHNGKIQFNQAA